MAERQQRPPLAIESEIRQFMQTVVGKSPATINTYAESLRRFTEFLDEAGMPPDALGRDMPPEVLERFYGWLVQNYGRDRRATITTYVSGARAFFRFLARRGLL